MSVEHTATPGSEADHTDSTDPSANHQWIEQVIAFYPLQRLSFIISV